LDLNIGAKRPVNGDLVWLVGRYLNSEPSYVLMYDASKSTPLSRYPTRRLKSVSAEAVVELLGGASVFGRLDVPDWGTAWIRRSMVLDVQPAPTELSSVGSHGFGAMILVRFEPPMLHHELVPAGLPFGFGPDGLTVDEVKRALNV
jgi:hypothetical protein